MTHAKNGLVPDNIFVSKRLQIAAMMMQGIVSRWDAKPTLLATIALQYADALIEAEGDEQIPTEN